MAVVTDRAQRRQLNPRGDPTSPWWHVDIISVIVPLVLSGIGLLMIYSATRGRDSENYITDIVERQGIFLGVAAALMVVIAVTDYRRFLVGARFAYVGCVVLLVLVLIPGIGELRNGARAWFSLAGFSFQPSEVMKLGLILALAWWLSEHPDGLDLNALGAAIGIAAVPVALVWVQPDIGTIMVFVAITAAMLLIGGIDVRHLLGLIVIGAAGLAISWPLLADYQKERLEGFLDPGGDAASVYNVEQAQIAIGNGGLSGRGFGQGTQTNSGLVPEQHTDFIFTVVGEEFGFVGGVITIALFALLIWRTYRTARLAGDSFGSLISVGVMAMIVFQMFQSIGMTMGLMPVTGIPLPFVSQGGSSLLTSFIAMGFILSVHMRRFQADLATRR